jgi:outer membrane protein TolC
VGRVEKEVQRFVQTGQRSVVERLLVQDQTTDAQMTAATFQSRYRVALERLAVVTGSSATALSCAVPQMIPEAGLGLLKAKDQSPLLLQAAAQAGAARAAVHVYSAQYAPRVLATASVGDMDMARLVTKKEYSGGFGVQLPLFDGSRINSTVHQAQALASARDNDQLAVRMDVEQLESHYDETIEASRVQLEYLQKELDVATRAFKLAKDRYVSFQGTLVDVREALRNLARVQEEMVDIKADLLLAVGSKMLLDGGTVESTAAD